MRRILLVPVGLLAAGVLAGRFVWPRQRGIPVEEKMRVNAAWSAAARETGRTTEVLTQRPVQPELGKMWDFLQRLEKMSATEFPELWEELEATGEKKGEGESPSSRKILLAERWAELDPEADYAFFAGKPDNTWLIAAVFRTWARMNVETALAAVTGEKDGNRQAAALAGI